MVSRFREGWRGELAKCPHCGRTNLFRSRCRACHQSLEEVKQ